MTDEQLEQISLQLFNRCKIQFLEFFDNFRNEINSGEIKDIELFYILANVIINLTTMLFEFSSFKGKLELKNRFMKQLTEYLFSEKEAETLVKQQREKNETVTH